MNQPSTRDILHRLGRGERISDLCASLGWPREKFDAWWQEESKSRVPSFSGSRSCRGLKGNVAIRRDDWGIPHIQAKNEHDLFFALGYATAQDRLFQLDYGRRKARGRLAEILGAEAIESDTLYRTLDLAGISNREWDHLPRETQDVLAAYAAGINAFLEEGVLPIEFDLLDYQPEPWQPTDSLAILNEFRWYLTGRFYVIAIPEMVKRALDDPKLYHHFLIGERDEESILHPGEYTPSPNAPNALPGGGGEGPGSNNWVLAGERTTTGLPIVASDPHIPYAAVSIWQEVHLDGGPYRVLGVALAGVPAVMIGRNENVAWGITNNICSQRDLYLEKADPAHPNGFLYHDGWETAREREEIIQVRGAPPARKVIRSSRNGPLVDEVLPLPARGTGPVSLRWLGFEPCGWLTAMLGMNRAASAQEFREATRPWSVPTFSLVYADRAGHIGYHAAGRIPHRGISERGYRHGWDPMHQWQGVLAFEDMPHLFDPARGYVATANNRVAPDDFPFPLSGTWAVGHRARRCRDLIEGQEKISATDCQQFQLDCFSLRARDGVPPLLIALKSEAGPREQRAAKYLRDWDFRVTTDSVAASIFNIFFAQWCRAVCRERFAPQSADFIAGNALGIAGRLLHGDDLGWFINQEREEALRAAFRAALEELEQRIGPDVDSWTWGEVHHLLQPHFLSGRGDLGLLLDRSGLSADGDGSCVNNGQTDAQHMCTLGPGYRMVADLSDPNGGIHAVEVGSVSGHPGSPHYDDQIEPWSEGKYHYLSLHGPKTEKAVFQLMPEGSNSAGS